jgi:hypothetical protein
VRLWPAALLAALALAGCGDELQEFRDDLRPLEQRAEGQRSEVGSELRATRAGIDSPPLRADTAALEATYDEIASLDAPSEYEKPFAAYVRANTRTVQGLKRYARALAAGNIRTLKRVARDVVRDLGESQTSRLHWLE